MGSFLVHRRAREASPSPTSGAPQTYTGQRKCNCRCWGEPGSALPLLGLAALAFCPCALLSSSCLTRADKQEKDGEGKNTKSPRGQGWGPGGIREAGGGAWVAASPGHSLRGGPWVRTRAGQGEKQKQRVGMLLAWVGAGQVAFLSDTPSPCAWGQPFGLGAHAALSPRGLGLQCPLSLLSQQPPPLPQAGEKLGGASRA